MHVKEHIKMKLKTHKKKLCIFSFFDKNGYVDDYVVYLLKEIKSVCSRLIIVVNGELDNRGKQLFLQFTTEVYVRDNVGFDAGAYKYILCHKLSEEEIKSYEEIILCNDTFYGPFIPLMDIFDKMKNAECDFWGLNGYFDWVYAHLQSYFIVFRKNIIEQGSLCDYFHNNVDENTIDINHVYCQFENGLFDYLVRMCGYKCAKYIEDNKNYDIYKYSYAYLNDLQFPIVKKRVFSFVDCAYDNAMRTLSFVKSNTNYDIGLILKNIDRIYGIKFKRDDIRELDKYREPEVSTLQLAATTTSQIERFLGNDKFYIYGAGLYACNTYWRYAKDNSNFEGFIISDGQTSMQDKLFGWQIYSYSYVKDITSAKVLLGVNSEIADAVIAQFDDKSKVLRIF